MSDILRDPDAGTGTGDGGGDGSGSILDGQPAFDVNNLIPEDLRAEPSLQNLKAAKDQKEYYGNLHKGFVAAQKMVGQQKDGLKVPGAEATDEEKNAYLKAIGRPDDASGYTIHPDQVGVRQDVMSDEVYTKLRDGIFALGAREEVGSGVLKLAVNMLSEARKGHDDQVAVDRVAIMDTLRGDWGVSLDQNIQLANEGVSAVFGSDEATHSKLMKSGLMDDPTFIKFMHTYATQIFAKQIADGMGQTSHGFRGAAAAGAELEALKGDKRHQDDLWGKNGDAAKTAAIARRRQLFQRSGKGA